MPITTVYASTATVHPWLPVVEPSTIAPISQGSSRSSSCTG
jgi:hypothetical protein